MEAHLPWRWKDDEMGGAWRFGGFGGKEALYDGELL